MGCGGGGGTVGRVCGGPLQCVLSQVLTILMLQRSKQVVQTKPPDTFLVVCEVWSSALLYPRLVGLGSALALGTRGTVGAACMACMWSSTSLLRICHKIRFATW